MEVKKDLKLFQELKDEAYLIPSDSIKNLKEKNKKYDIDPTINFDLLTKLLDSSNPEFIENYFNLIQTLTFQQKSDLLKKLKDHPFEEEIKSKIGINNKSYIDCYFSILKKMYNYFYENLTYNELENALKTEFYVDNEKLKIPLIYGTKELIYSSLINNIYHYFILNYKDGKESEDENIKINNTNKESFFQNYPKIILERKNKNDIKIEEINKMEIENNIQNNVEEISEEEKDKVLEDKCLLIRPILDLIFENNDFFDLFNVKGYKNENEINNFQNNYKLKPNFDPLIFHLLFLDFIICIYVYLNKRNFLTKNIIDMFFEKRETKLMRLKHFLKSVNIETQDGKKLKFNILSDVRNEVYKCYDKKNKDNFFSFNPYEHVLSKIQFYNFDSFKEKFNDKQYFSLLKYYNSNHLFDKSVFENIFKENIKEMLQSKTINGLFSQFTNFSEFNNPFIGKKKNEFFEQVSESILFFPFPTDKIGGFTYKNLGIIFINNFSEKKKLVDSSLLIYNICELSIYKVTFKHEIIAHYMSSICHANDVKVKLKTPPNTLNDFGPMEIYSDIYDNSLDAGDKGEALIFGNKIKGIFIRGALFILNNNNWNKNNNVEDFQNEFIGANKYFENDQISIKELESENILIKELLTDIHLNEDCIKLNKTNSSYVFRQMNENYYYEGEDEGIDNYFFYFDRINFAQPPYQKIDI